MLEMLKERKAALEAQGKKGFTLMEMLIVIAIIAILIAIAIPVFTAQLTAANQATNAANLRSAYAEASAEYILSQSSGDITVTEVKLKADGVGNNELPFSISSGSIATAGTYSVTFDFTEATASSGTITNGTASATATRTGD